MNTKLGILAGAVTPAAGSYHTPDDDSERVAAYHGHGGGSAQWRPANPPRAATTGPPGH